MTLMRWRRRRSRGCSHRELRVAQGIAVCPSTVVLLARQRVALQFEKQHTKEKMEVEKEERSTVVSYKTTLVTRRRV